MRYRSLLDSRSRSRTPRVLRRILSAGETRGSEALFGNVWLTKDEVCGDKEEENSHKLNQKYTSRGEIIDSSGKTGIKSCSFILCWLSELVRNLISLLTVLDLIAEECKRCLDGAQTPWVRSG